MNNNFYSSEDYKLSSLQPLVEKYLLLKEDAVLTELKEKVTLYIKFYPTFAFRVTDEDTLSDFYLVILSCFENILNHYDPSKKILFKTYLSQSLRNRWINFVQSQNKKINSMNNEFILNTTKSSNNQIEELNLFDKRKKINHLFTEEKDKLKYLILKLYYYDFFDEDDFILLSKTTEKSFGDCLDFYNNLLNNVREKRYKKNKYETIFLKAQVSIQKIKNSYNDKKKEEKLRKSFEKYFYFYKRIQEVPSIEIIADFLNCNPSNIIYTINIFKKKVRSMEDINKYWREYEN